MSRDITFINGTIVDPDWLQEVNDHKENKPANPHPQYAKQTDLTAHLAENAKMCITVTNPPIPLIAAKGDGIHDDFPAIKAAIENTDYPVVIIPKGTYKIKITSTITVPPNKTIIQTSDSKLIADPTTGEWYCFLQSDPVSLDNVTVDGLNFDSNTENNVGGSRNDESNAQYLILFNRGSGENITVKNCNLKSASKNIIMVNAPVSGVLVEKNKTEFVHKNEEWDDNTAIYISCSDYVCCNNIVKSSSPLAQTGIEIHTGRANCYDNIIHGYVDGADIVSTDIALDYKCAINFHDNIIDAKRGINIWSLSGMDIENTNVHHNNLTVEWSGIMRSNGTGAFKDSKVVDNLIFYPIGAKPPAVGADESGISLFADSPVINVDISRNKIINPPYVGIMLGESDTYERTNLSVCDNEIINPCCDTEYEGNYRAAFFIPYSMTGIVDENKILNPNNNWGVSYRGIGTHTPNQDKFTFGRNQIPPTMTFSIVEHTPYADSNELYGTNEYSLKHFRNSLNPIYNVDQFVGDATVLKGLYEVGDVVMVGSTQLYRCTAAGTILNESIFGGGILTVSGGVQTYTGCEKYPIRAVVELAGRSGRIVQNIFGQLYIAANMTGIADGIYPITYHAPTWNITTLS